MLLAIVTLFVAFVLLALDWLRNRSKGLPPGPTGIPLLGYLPFLKNDAHKVLDRLGKEYGGLYTISLGLTPAVVVTDWKVVKEAFLKQSELFSGRPKLFTVKMTVNNADIAFGEGPVWKEHRRFTLHHLRNFGIGKQSLETVIMEKVEELVNHVAENIDRDLDLSEIAFLPVLSIIWTITAGKAFKANDEYMLSFAEVMKESLKMFLNGNILNTFPWTRFFPGSSYKSCLESHLKVSDFLRKEIKEHQDTYAVGEPRDLIDVFIAEIMNTSKDKQEIGPFNDDHLFGTIHNMFFGGTETVTTTIGWGLLYMGVWPEIQIKVQKELDAIIGRNRPPTYADRINLPYTEATLMELQRYASSAGSTVAKCPTRDAVLMGFKIPKGTFMIQNIYAVHFDPELWGDPHVFRPERFLDAEGKVVKPEYFIPFSLGARVCLGEPLARMEQFMFLANLLQRFTFRCKTGEAPPSLEPVVSGTLQPKPYHLKIERR